MQLHLILSGDRIVIPINYRPLVQGMIYQALSADPQYFHYMHEMRNRQPGRTYKGFCFSDLQGKCTVQEYSLIFTESVSLEIRSIDPIMIALLYHTFSSCPEVRIGETILQITECRMGNIRIRDNLILARLVSPAVAYSTDENRYINYYAPEEPAFYEQILDSAERKCAYFGVDVPFDLEIMLSPHRKPRKQLSRFKQTYVIGWYADLALRGNPSILDLLYQTGIGSRNPEGYGLFVCKQAENLS